MESCEVIEKAVDQYKAFRQTAGPRTQFQLWVGLETLLGS
jgi:hypothetical protein